MGITMIMCQKIIKGFLTTIALILVTPGFFATTVAASEQPVSRTFYPDLQFIEMKELKDNFFDYVAVDVRTRYEYDLMRIEDALSIPASNSDFIARLHALKTMNKLPLVFYSNGKLSKNAHNAARLAAKNGFTNIKVMDHGINSWERHYPKLTIFRGLNRIPANETIKRTLSNSIFNSQLHSLNGLLVDIRGNLAAANPMDTNAVKAPLDNKKRLKNTIDLAIQTKRTLFFYDNQGLQYQWLIYRLKQAGLEDFYFLKGGSQGVGSALSYTVSQNN